MVSTGLLSTACIHQLLSEHDCCVCADAPSAENQVLEEETSPASPEPEDNRDRRCSQHSLRGALTYLPLLGGGAGLLFFLAASRFMLESSVSPILRACFVISVKVNVEEILQQLKLPTD